MDFQFGSKRKAKHIKTECIGLIPDRGRSTRQGGTVVGWAAHVGGWAARSQARLGPTLASTVLGPLLPEFHDLRDWVSSLLSRCVSPTLVFLYTFMHNMWRQNTYPKEIESR